MKVKQKKSSKKLLSDKIADTLTIKPRADIEDDQVFGTKPKTVTRDDIESSESEVETAISDFRKLNVNLLSNISKKYQGEVVSRKAFEEPSDEDDSDLDSLDEGQHVKDSRKKISSSQESDSDEKKASVDSKSDNSDLDGDSEKQMLFNDSDDDAEVNSEVSDEGDGSDDEDDDEGEGYDISQMEVPLAENFEHVKKQNISEESKKGHAVRSQLLLWEGLLEIRIHLQRCVNTANQMPMPETFKDLKSKDTFLEDAKATTANVSTVLDKLMSLQNILLSKYPETNSICNKSQTKGVDKKIEANDDDENEEIPSDTEDEEIPSDTDAEEEEVTTVTKGNNIKNTTAKKRKLEDYEMELSKSHKAFKTFRDTSIQKWSDKTRLATATNLKNAPTNTVLQQISYILSDREKLVRRTQLKRSEYDIVGYKRDNVDENKNENDTELNHAIKDRKSNDEYIPEIFDDSDFYHQLLRELIECKSADISDPVQLSRQWIALQQMRSKMKRKVDTKATKGRKIKYVVHNKLVNFMAPEKNFSWTDDSKNELYSSLFGKMFEQNNAGVNGDALDGFRFKS